MKAGEIREGDIVEIDYVTEFTKEHMNEGKALVIWKSFNNQPLVRKLDTKAAIWTCYEHIARVVGHIDIVGYMDRALSAEPCDDAISRQAVINVINQNCIFENEYNLTASRIKEKVQQLPSVTSTKEKTGKWIKTQSGDDMFPEIIVCSKCNNENSHLDFNEHGEPIGKVFIKSKYCPNCGARMVEPQESEET